MIFIYKNGREKDMNPIIEEIAREVQVERQMRNPINLEFVKEVVKRIVMEYGNIESIKFQVKR